MSVFKRTISGLSNQHLFHNVELIVFVEGGISYTKSEVYSGSYNEESNDILFWKSIFKHFKNATKIKFKSVGSKTTIKDIAIDIVNGNISTVMVAMDNEFDEILNKRIDHRNIFYTHGYSWENDIWNDLVVREIIEELSAVEIDSAILQKNFASFFKKITIAVYTDGYLFSKGDSFFQRPKGYLKFVNCSPADLPHVKYDLIQNEIISKGIKKSTVYSFARRRNIDKQKHCYGHFFADYCCQLIIHFLRNRLSLPSVNKDIIYRMGINKFFQRHFTNSLSFGFYETQFLRVSISEIA